MCSTPFGIIGILTQKWTLVSSEIHRVLNAFRHHRNSHSQQHENHPITIPVLNAFRHHRNSHSLTTNSARVWCFVLNAFRHHRNSHRRGTNRTTSLSCAQRLSASSEFSQWNLFLESAFFNR